MLNFPILKQSTSQNQVIVRGLKLIQTFPQVVCIFYVKFSNKLLPRKTGDSKKTQQDYYMDFHTWFKNIIEDTRIVTADTIDYYYYFSNIARLQRVIFILIIVKSGYTRKINHETRFAIY